MNALKCSVTVRAGILVGEWDDTLTRRWEFTQDDLDHKTAYVDGTGAAMNYAFSLQNPQRNNYVQLEWVWY